MTEAEAASIPGVVRLTARALRSCATAVAAEQLGAEAGQVSVALADDRGRLALRIASPLGVLHPGVVAAADGAREGIRSRVQELTGRQVGRVDLTVTRRT